MNTPKHHSPYFHQTLLPSLGLGLILSLAATLRAAFPLAGADQSTPSLSHYFSWVDNTNVGATGHQGMEEHPGEPTDD